MAEVATILAFAQSGFKLSMTLFSFAAAIGSAGKEIIQTGKDISLFSSVLRQLGLVMQRAHKSGLITDDAFKTTNEIVRECRSIFGELENIIEKATTTEIVKVVKMEVHTNEVKEIERESLSVSYGRRLLYLFRKSTILEQKTALESLKSSLQLMLMLMTFTESKMHFAEDEQKRPANMEAFLQDEKLALESLVLANQAATTEFRKQKPKMQFKKSEESKVGSITSFGILGPEAQGDSNSPASAMSSSASKSKPQPTKYDNPKSSPALHLFGSLKAPERVDSQPVGFVVIPPSLSYDKESHISSSTSTDKAPISDVAGDKNRTPDVAVNILLKRMTTQKGQTPPQPKPPTHKSSPSTTSKPPTSNAGSDTTTKSNLSQKNNEPETTPPPYECALPQGWGQRRDHRGFAYFVDHNTQTTTWTSPTMPSPSLKNEDTAELGGQTQGDPIKPQQPFVEDQDDEEPLIDLYPRRAPRPY